MKIARHVFLGALLSGAVMGGMLAIPAVSFAQSDLTAVAQKELKGKKFSHVQVSVQNGVATLTGNVGMFYDSQDAEKRVAKVPGVSSVTNQITIEDGKPVSDADLQAKLGKQLVYFRVGYWSNMFNALTLNVQQGVVTVGGFVVNPADKNAAIALIVSERGVRGLVDHIEVGPPSPMDDGLRRRLAQAIYGAAQLNRYAIDPAKPIRILVKSGHVILVGSVDSKADRDIAGIRANGVGGVFSVDNQLLVAGSVE
ncbi:MAG: BON domain-containing protein [Acidobacteriaceae bacterium]|nr:BON domain-containing protein [Acidobacteriaceae bacterium]